jgi:hypothetical protein
VHSNTDKTVPGPADAADSTEPLTDALVTYEADYRDVIGFILFITQLSKWADQSREKLLRALEDIDPADPVDLKRRAVDEFKAFRPLTREMLLNRFVDNFLTYVAQLLALAFKTRPDMLKSNEKVEVGFVLEHRTTDELTEALADRRVERLSYQGLEALAADLRTGLGFELIPDETRFQSAVELVEMRNLLVHNRGIVNRRYRGRVAGAPPLGEHLRLTSDIVVDGLQLLTECATDIDRRAVAKWALPASPPQAETSPRRSARHVPQDASGD